MDDRDIEAIVAAIGEGMVRGAEEVALELSEKLGLLPPPWEPSYQPRVSADGRITERDACRVLGVSPSRLRVWAAEHYGPRFIRRALFGCPRSYSLAECRAYREAQDASRDG